jgi:thiamine biosynthesis lipoprotein
MIYKTEFKAMGCQMLAALEYPSPRGSKLLARVPEWFEAWEASLSRFRPESELNRLNDSPGIAVQVSETLWNVFQASLNAEEQSGGLVTPTLLEALVTAGYSSSFDQLAPEKVATHSASHLLYPLQAVECWRETLSIRLPAGLHLDFGGVAKGWVAHQAMQRLRGYGPALVDAGGDIAISGLQAGGQPWLVGVDDPLHPEACLRTLMLGRCGVATSGRDYRRWKQGETWKHHIIDPRTGEPAVTDVLTATVIAPTVLEAEMAAKVIIILGSQAGRDWLEARPTFAGMFVTESGQVVYCRSFEKYLWE